MKADMGGREGEMRGEGRWKRSDQLSDDREGKVLTGVTGLGVECSSVVLRHCDRCLYVGYGKCKCG